MAPGPCDCDNILSDAIESLPYRERVRRDQSSHRLSARIFGSAFIILRARAAISRSSFVVSYQVSILTYSALRSFTGHSFEFLNREHPLGLQLGKRNDVML